MNYALGVKVNNLVKKYLRTEALKGVDVTFPPGEITGVVGPNGSGKTTLLKCIMGFLRLTSGSIEFINHNEDMNLNEKVAFLPEINHLYSWMTVENIIGLYDSQYKNFDPNRAYAIMEFMNLNPEEEIKNLSKGMAARVKLVVTMARKSPLLIMDEPLAGIDPKSRSQILESLINEYEAGEQTIIISTHEVLEAELFFDNVVFLEEGKIKLHGNAEELRQEYGKSIQDILKEVYV